PVELTCRCRPIGRLEMVTVAPATTAPEASTTVPPMAPSPAIDWPFTDAVPMTVRRDRQATNPRTRTSCRLITWTTGRDNAEHASDFVGEHYRRSETPGHA